jgi:membrane protein DedA with SNARE-associated domain
MFSLSSISQHLLSLVFQYKYFFLYPITVVEGPLVTMAAGFMISLKVMNFAIALPIIVVGDVSGDVLYYFVGRFGERWSFTRFMIKKVGLEKQKEKMVQIFHQKGGRILIFGKITHALGALFLIGAGYSKMNLLKFIWCNTLGTIVKSSLLLYLGYVAGSAYSTYAKYFEYGAILITAFALLALFVFSYFSGHVFDKTIGIKD